MSIYIILNDLNVIAQQHPPLVFSLSRYERIRGKWSMRILRVTMVRIFLLKEVNYWKFGCVYEPRDYPDKFVVWSEG